MAATTEHGKTSDFSFEPSASSASQSLVNSPVHSPMLSRNDTIVETIVESVEAEDNRQLQISASSFPCPFPRDTKECGETEEKTCQSRLASSRAQPTTFTNKFKPQLVLENHGSVARDHLASERTFLAYVRTSLAVASTGVALVQLLTLSVDASTRGSSTSLTLEPMSRQMRMYAKPLGATFVVFSIVVLAVGLTRYFSIQNALTLNQFPVARLVIISSSFILGALVVCTFGILVAGSS